MKKTLLFALLATFATSLSAQFSSTEAKIGGGSVKGHTTFIRSCNDTLAVMYNYDLNLPTGEHRFTIRNLNNSATVSFKLIDAYTLGFDPFPLVTPPSSGDTLYFVHDMEIIERFCYFCGTLRVTTGNYIYDMNGNMTFQTDDIGFVGRFSIDDILAGNATYQITSVNDVITFDRIALRNAGLTVIGHTKPDPNQPVSASCIVDIYGLPSSSSWTYDAAYPYNTNEFFSDIFSTGNAIITVSRLRYDNHKFILRATKAYSSLLEINGCIQNPFCFSTTSASIVSNDILPTFRQDEDPLYLYALEKDKVLYVAHPCAGQHFGTAIYQMYLDNPCDTIYNTANQYAEEENYSALKGLLYTSPNKTVFALTENTDDNIFGIRLTSFSNTSDYTDYRYYHPDRRIRSFDLLQSTKILYGGTYLADNAFFQAHYGLPHYSPGSIPLTNCLGFPHKKNYILKPLTSVIYGNNLNIFKSNIVATWVTYTSSTVQLTNTAGCPFSF